MTTATKTRKLSTEDRLTRSQTAFFSWQDFLTSLRDGYVPTLRNTPACHKLARIIRAAGYRVFMLK